MIIAGKYSFKHGEEYINKNYPGFIKEVEEVIESVSAKMSTGVSYFEQFVWDLEHRGVSDIDIPVLILGIDVDKGKS